MTTENIYHVMKDPVHGTMQFTALENNWIKPFIDSPHFQRLRHIKQLGMGDFIFPGAVHTRFNHCLGCCYVASQIAHKIGLPENERQLVMIACLLHDIGHGPFSHAFEDLFEKNLIRHEAWTPFFLADYRHSDFFSHYNQKNPQHPLTEEKFNRIESMICHTSPVKSVLADIVSSQLDADRLDYLLRDGHFCGVKYGEFDLRWMLHSMVILDTPQGQRLGLTHKGIGVAEHYLMARRLMTRNIYFHQKKLAFEFFLVQLLTHLAKDLTNYPPFEDIKKTRLGIFLANTYSLNQAIADKDKLKNNKKITKNKQAFLSKNYENYKALCDYDVFTIIKLLAERNVSHPAVDIAKRLYYREMPKIIHVEPSELSERSNTSTSNLSKIKIALNQLKLTYSSSIQDWQIHLIQVPSRSYTVDADPILISNEHHVIKPLNQLSLMIDAIGDKEEQLAFLCIDKKIHQHREIQAFINKNISLG